MIFTTTDTRTGRVFTVRTVVYGERYGLDWCLTHDMKEGDHGPLVEFYDATHEHTATSDEDLTAGGRMLGQFVSRYYLKTLMCNPGGPLTLEGSVPEWRIDAAGMVPVYRALTAFQLAHWFVNGDFEDIGKQL